MDGLRLGAAVALMLAAGCDRPLTGGALVPSSRIPAGALVGSYTPVACTDGSDRSTPRVFDHMRDAQGVSFLVERAASSDWMVITNAFRDGSTMVFQAIQESAQPRLVWEYRVPAEGAGQGIFRTSSSFTLEAEPGGPFRATLHSELSRCTLQKVGAEPAAAPSASTSGTSKPVSDPAPLATGVTEPKSWGYDGSSFKAGDRVLVDAGRRSVVATVIKVEGEQYYVHFEGSPAQAGAWVKPWKIVGRIRPSGL